MHPTEQASRHDAATFRTPEAARYISMSKSWLEKAACRGEVPHVKLGRARVFLKKDLDAFLESKKA